MRGEQVIKGIGNDILEIDRIREAIKRHGDRFYRKIFTLEEVMYAHTHRDPAVHLTGRFCAKEAVVKALGVGFGRYIAFQDIAITKDPLGRPLVTLSEAASAHFHHPYFLLSISHCKHYATAVAIWVNPTSGNGVLDF